MKKEIEQTLKVLVGMPLWGSHRAADLQVFKFGKQIPSISRATNRRPVEAVVIGEYALHAQCPWRIVQGVAISVASGDLYYAAGDDPYKDHEEFDWDEQPSRRDERISTLFTAWADNPPIVESVEAEQGTRCPAAPLRRAGSSRHSRRSRQHAHPHTEACRNLAHRVG
jgi:hypothetical protein